MDRRKAACETAVSTAPVEPRQLVAQQPGACQVRDRVGLSIEPSHASLPHGPNRAVEGDIAPLGIVLDTHLAAETLGWSARREAVASLLGALKDKDPDVCKAARASLHRLSGNRDPWPDFAKLLGRKGEKLDIAKAKRWPKKKPGIYRLGR